SSLVPSFLFSPPLPPRSTLFPYTTLFRSCASTASRRFLNGKLRPRPEFARALATIGSISGRSRDLRTALWARPLLFSRSRTTTRSEEHTSELQSLAYLVCRLLLEKKNKK